MAPTQLLENALALEFGQAKFKISSATGGEAAKILRTEQEGKKAKSILQNLYLSLLRSLNVDLLEYFHPPSASFESEVVTERRVVAGGGVGGATAILSKKRAESEWKLEFVAHERNLGPVMHCVFDEDGSNLLSFAYLQQVRRDFVFGASPSFPQFFLLVAPFGFKTPYPTCFLPQWQIVSHFV